MRRLLHTLLAFSALSVASCGDDMYDNSPDEALKLSITDTIRVDLTAQIVTLGVNARDGVWTSTGWQSWCVPDTESGEKGITQVRIAFTANESGESEPEALTRKTTLTFTSGGKSVSVVVQQLNTEIIPPNVNPDYNVNQAIFEELKMWYFNGEPRDVLSDPNQSYDDFYFNFLARGLKHNEDFEGNTWATVGQFFEERYIYSLIEKNPLGTALSADPLPPLNYGMEFDLNEYDGRLVGRILYVEPGSPAEVAGLRRGDWFFKVNDRGLSRAEINYGDNLGWQYNRFIDSLVNPVEGFSPKLGMMSFRAAQQSLVDEGRTVTITPARHRNAPILGAQVFRTEHLPAGSGENINVGYLMYNNFDPAYKGELERVFQTVFKPGVGGQPLDNFILDLRYNKSGSVDMAHLMGNLLVGDTEGVEGTGTLFSEYVFDPGNTEAPTERRAEFAPHEHGIGVDTLFILTSKYTAGPSELLINALRGIDQNVVKLVVVGESTQGLAAGMVKRTVDHLDPEWEYSAWMLAFRVRNAQNQGDYTWGLIPNGGTVDEWNRDNIVWSSTWEWKGVIGSTEDALIKSAVDMIIGREFIPEANVINGNKHQRTGLPRKFCFPTTMTMTVEN